MILVALTFVIFAPSPQNAVAFTVPLTSNMYVALTPVPIPTLPSISVFLPNEIWSDEAYIKFVPVSPYANKLFSYCNLNTPA